MKDRDVFVCVESFRRFLGGIRPRRFCVPCLAKLYEQPARLIREHVGLLADQMESLTAECQNCTQTILTHRLAALPIQTDRTAP